MTSPATRIYVRHAGDDAAFYAERDRKAAERRAELEARMAENPELAAEAEAMFRRRRR